MLQTWQNVFEDYISNANMADHSVGARNELHESEASEASVFCFDNLPLKNLASWSVSFIYLFFLRYKLNLKFI